MEAIWIIFMFVMLDGGGSSGVESYRRKENKKRTNKICDIVKIWKKPRHPSRKIAYEKLELDCFGLFINRVLDTHPTVTTETPSSMPTNRHP